MPRSHAPLWEGCYFLLNLSFPACTDRNSRPTVPVVASPKETSGGPAPCSSLWSPEVPHGGLRASQTSGLLAGAARPTQSGTLRPEGRAAQDSTGGLSLQAPVQGLHIYSPSWAAWAPLPHLRKPPVMSLPAACDKPGRGASACRASGAKGRMGAGRLRSCWALLPLTLVH